MSSFYRGIRRFRPVPGHAPSRWVVVFYDQLRPVHPLLAGPAADTGVIFVETSAKPARRPYAKQKLVLLISAMRHDAESRGRAGHPVLYHSSDQWYDGALTELREQVGLTSAEALAPAEAEAREAVSSLDWLRLHPNTLFATDTALYQRVFPRPGARRLDPFYRAARVATGLLMDGRRPMGGAWSFDSENRKTWRGYPQVPARPILAVDDITREVIDLVNRRYPDAPGTTEGFNWPVSAADATVAAEAFFATKLASFGPYEDAIADTAPELFHSLLSASINLGQLDPLVLCQRAETAYRQGDVPLASAEGFIRQILGWREFMRHVYDEGRSMYGDTNALEARLPLPAWYWGEPSGMRCLDHTVRQVLHTGYSHHITRLMVLCNVATLLGVNPHALNEWFWTTYVDAYEWVVTPNVVGMGTYADGGRCATKPYISSGKYVQRMGPSICAGCQFDPALTTGATACPLNHLYWDFLERQRDRLKSNVRMAVPLAALTRLAPAVMDDHRAHAARWRERAVGG